MKYGIIYKAFNKVNNKPYIGQTTDSLSERISKHFYKGHIERGSDKSIFHKALIKYGYENFEWAIICEGESKDDLNEKEMLYIKQFGSHYKDGFGYNMTYGGESSAGFRHSDESKRKMSEKSKGRPSVRKGKKGPSLSAETRKKMSLARRGLLLSEKTKEKLRLANIGKRHTEATKEKLKNRIFTAETKRKMSLARIGMLPWNKGLKIKPSEQWVKRQEESHSKTYRINVNRVVVETKNLAKFCRGHNINKSSLMSAVRKGHKYKGIFVEKIGECSGA